MTSIDLKSLVDTQARVLEEWFRLPESRRRYATDAVAFAYRLLRDQPELFARTERSRSRVDRELAAAASRRSSEDRLRTQAPCSACAMPLTVATSALNSSLSFPPAGAPAPQQIHLHEMHRVDVRVAQHDRALHRRLAVQQALARRAPSALAARVQLVFGAQQLG